MDTIKNYIDGKWVVGGSGRTFDSINPADRREVIATVSAVDKSDIDHAVEAARKAYKTWSRTPAPKRGEILFRAAEGILREKDRLGALVTREMGKVLKEGLGDVREAADIAYYMAGEGRRLSGETVPSELMDKDMKSVREPVGVFALVTPWNFPIAIPAWKIFAALIAGNTAVFKPSSLTPACAYELVRILEAAGLPPGVLNLVNGPGGETGDYLVTHPGIDGVSFTGSSLIGEHIIKTVAKPGRRVTAEMGGKNAIVVMDDADIGLAVEGAIWGGFGTSGQRCTAASRVVVHKDVYNEFLDRFVAAAKSLKLGDGLKPATDVGPIVSDEQLKRVLYYMQLGINEGAKVETGGQHCTHPGLEYGYFMEPTVLTGVTRGMRVAHEEIFGPVVAVMKADSFEDAIDIVNATDYGLVASIYTRDTRKAAVAERDIETGIVYVNASTIGAEVHLPFGGFKRSGYGGKEAGGRGGALDVFTRWKTIYRDFSGRLQKAQIT